MPSALIGMQLGPELWIWTRAEDMDCEFGPDRLPINPDSFAKIMIKLGNDLYVMEAKGKA